MNNTIKQGRVAGAIYLLMVLAGPPALILLPNRLIVRGNGSATAQSIITHPALARLWVVTDLWTHVIFICLGIALYRLLRRVSKDWSLLMFGFVLVSAAVGFLNTLNDIAAVTVFGGPEYLSALAQPQREGLGMLFIRLHSEGNFINEMFWGLWLFPFGLLVFRSGFLPRWLGVWLMVDCFAWLVLSPIALFWPAYYESAFRYAQPFLFAELGIMLWLLIKGARADTTVAEQPIAAMVI